VFHGVSLVGSDWEVSKAKRVRVGGVVGVVLVPGVHAGYCVDHFPHFRHPHHHHHPLHRRRPTSVRFPNWEGIERLTTTISEDSHDEG